MPISMILFDELGLVEISKNDPLKVLDSKLEYLDKEKGISFIGISNCLFDPAKLNKALIFSVLDLDQEVDELIKTSHKIFESVSNKLQKDKIFEILSKTYFNYKRQLLIIKELIVYKEYVNVISKQYSMEIDDEINTVYAVIDLDLDNYKPKRKTGFEDIKIKKQFKDLFIKENKIRKDFHGNNDFYNLIKGIAIEFGRLGNVYDENDKLQIIEKHIERNFGGINYKIDIDFNLIIDDIREKIFLIKDILKDYDDDIKKLNSAFLFKKLYNINMEKEIPDSRLIIKKENLNNYKLNKSINDNIKDINSRFLLLEVNQSLANLLCQIIKLQNPFKEIIIYDGSPFEDDNKKEYWFKIIKQIQENVRDDKLIIIDNLNQIHPFLINLYNKNYIIKDEKKFVRICLEDKFGEQLTEINDKLRIIILVDKQFVKKANLALLYSFEKLVLSFDKLLDIDLKKLSNNILDEIDLKRTISNYKDINYEI
jgi:hypothetical protein